MEQTRQPASGRDALIVGLVFVLVGTAALVSQLWPDFDRYLPLGIGLGLLAVFAVTRSYAALVPGAILSGIGIGLLVAQIFPSDEADGVGAVLGLGLGFVSIWLLSNLMSLPFRHWWPLVPGTILIVVGAGLMADLFATDLGSLVVPIVVVAIGGLIIARGVVAGRNPPQRHAP